MKMKNVLATATVFTVLGAVLCCSPVDAFESLFQNGSLKGNAWDIQQSSNVIYAPNLDVKIRGFNDETFKLDVKWEKSTTSKKVEKYGNYFNEKGKRRSGWHYETEYVTKWVPTEVRKNGNKEFPENIAVPLDKIFEDITGYNVYEKSNAMYGNYGVKESIYNRNWTYHKYDGYDNLVYTQKVEEAVYVFPLYSRQKRRIIIEDYSYWGPNYYPALDEYLDGSSSSSCRIYICAKNSAGVWKKQQILYGKEDGYWTTVEDKLVPVLDRVQNALGIVSSAG